MILAIGTMGVKQCRRIVQRFVPAKKIAERDSSKANRQNAWQYHWNAQGYRRGEHRAWTGQEFEAWIKEINRLIESDKDLDGIRS